MKIKNFILNRGLFAFFVFVIMAVVSVQAIVALAINNFTKVAQNVTCNVKSFETDGNSVNMNLDCGGKENLTNNAKVVVSYIQNPGPLTCTLYKMGGAACKPREPLKK